MDNLKVNRQKDRFLNELRAAIILAGGANPDFVEHEPMGELYDILIVNGIKLKFTFGFSERTFG